LFFLNLISARFRLFVLIIGLISLLTVLAQIIFQSILLADKPYGHTINNCMKEMFFFKLKFFIKSIIGTEITRVLRYFGLERYIL
jgi:hypothetical protein